jgi:hypothetical protein
VSDPGQHPTTLHTVPKAVKHARLVLGDPSLTDSKFRHWIDEGKVRYRKFGGVYSFQVDELNEDLAGKPEA